MVKPYKERGQPGEASFMNVESFVVSALLGGLALLPQGLALPRFSCLPHHMTMTGQAGLLVQLGQNL